MKQDANNPIKQNKKNIHKCGITISISIQLPILAGHIAVLEYDTKDDSYIINPDFDRYRH